MKTRHFVLLTCVALFVVWVINVRQENKQEIAQYNQQIDEMAKKKKVLIDECIDKGIKYYKDIEAYPRLTSTGELAIDVITKACNHDITVFDK
jgi:uncharacterized membrane protein